MGDNIHDSNNENVILASLQKTIPKNKVICNNRFTCRYCNYMPTRTISPMMIRKLNNRSFHVSGLCEICLRTKSKFLSDYQVKQLPNVVYNIRTTTGYLEYVEDEKGNLVKIFPILDKIIN